MEIAHVEAHADTAAQEPFMSHDSAEGRKILSVLTEETVRAGNEVPVRDGLINAVAKYVSSQYSPECFGPDQKG
jgi:hypothetical protein